ncbi:MAG TPA: NfeD family protein [Pyrinomonadaceae bacterium]|nr:NfeD family protein [Pyrinomonadaceae bacterium]
MLFLVVLLVAACALVVAAMSRHKKGARGELKLEGRVAVVVAALEPEGAVLVDGELWRARTREGVRVAQEGRVRVVGARGHLLEVEPVG